MYSFLSCLPFARYSTLLRFSSYSRKKKYHSFCWDYTRLLEALYLCFFSYVQYLNPLYFEKLVSWKEDFNTPFTVTISKILLEENIKLINWITFCLWFCSRAWRELIVCYEISPLNPTNFSCGFDFDFKTFSWGTLKAWRESLKECSFHNNFEEIF